MSISSDLVHHAMFMAVQAIVTVCTVSILEEIFAVLILPLTLTMIGNLLDSVCVRCQISMSAGFSFNLTFALVSLEGEQLIGLSGNLGLFAVDMGCSKGVCLY